MGRNRIQLHRSILMLMLMMVMSMMLMVMIGCNGSIGNSKEYRTTWNTPIPMVHTETPASTSTPIPLSHDQVQEQVIDVLILFNDISNNIAKSIDLPICLWDERLSTVGAFNISSQLDINVTKRERDIDKNAAAFILQGAIDYLNN